MRPNRSNTAPNLPKPFTLLMPISAGREAALKSSPRVDWYAASEALEAGHAFVLGPIGSLIKMFILNEAESTNYAK